MKIITGIIIFILSSLAIAKEISIDSTGISFNAPDDFNPIAQEIIDLKWPQKRAPKWVVGNESASTTIAYDLKPRDISGAPLDELMNNFTTLFERIIPGISWKERKIIDLSGRQWVYLEMTSNAIDTDIYNMMLVTSYKNKMLLFNFNSTKADFKRYEVALRKSISSIIVPSKSK